MFYRQIAALVLVLAASSPLSATILYGTSDSQSALIKIDTVLMTSSLVLNTPSNPDSLIFDGVGRIIYDDINTGEIRRYDPNLLSDTLLSSLGGTPVDLQLEPGGNSVLVSLFTGGKIDRIDLNTFAVSTLGTYGGNPEGLAYDPAGNLFANLGTRDSGPNKFIARLDPVTGAILQQSAGISALDGLVYDAFTGQLFASLLNNAEVCAFNPVTLLMGTCYAGIPSPDGITSDGAGNIFVVSRGDSHVYRVDLTVSSGNVSQNVLIAGLDDLAPASGLGSNTPEPSAIFLAAGGFLAFGARRLFAVLKK
jgi:streptogramin lyase